MVLGESGRLGRIRSSRAPIYRAEDLAKALMSFPVITSRVIPDLGTDEAVAITIEHMRTLAHNDCQHPIVTWSVADILRVSEAQTTKQYVEACYAFTQGKMRFKTDEQSVSDALLRNGDNTEYLQSPAYLLAQETPQGDCDCYSTLLACLLLAQYVPCAFVTIAANPETPNNFSHVYVSAFLPREGRIALDASHGSYPGWEYPDRYRLEEWSL